ncbi:hypothetical protein T484DRAFT_1949084 [Baffinella frigidus]|nr:hypothetical protein T484DRAFT_1949084 [Cryptophyta sp. CCMP2293]|mmetsp:Transcript_55942/g.133564  ORF Transcript_55942/g.133564 Transcript_55942/m.133564 type:complete len:345 (-) Transcript_55942:222-1256(-)
MGVLRENTVNGAPDIHTFLKSMMANGEIRDNECLGEGADQPLSQILRKSFKEKVKDEKGVYLIPGSPKIVMFEEDYSNAQINTFAPVVRYGLRYLIDIVCKRYAIDYVILDFGPSASSLNINWLASCDFVLPPTFPDYFSCCSLDGLLTQIMPKVYNHFDQQIEKQNAQLTRWGTIKNFFDAEYQEKFKFKSRLVAAHDGLPAWRYNGPRLLASVVTNFATNADLSAKGGLAKNRAGGDIDGARRKFVTKAASKWIKTLKEIMYSNTVLEKIKNFYVPSGAGGPGFTMAVALTQDVNSGQQISHATFCPVPYFTETVLKSPGAIRVQGRPRPPGANLSSSSGLS